MEKRKVLITGASGGLGKSLSLEFAASGDDVLITGRNIAELEFIKKSIDNMPVHPQCEIIVGDITSSNTIQRLRDKAFEMDIDTLINCAGIYAAGLFSDMSMVEIRQMIDINLMAPIELTKKIFPLFMKNKDGLIININSIAGKLPNGIEAAYCASKHGLRGFSNSLKFEASMNNIKIIDVYLGAMKTRITDNRPNQNKLIEPSEAAETIYNLTKDCRTLRIPEIEIVRSRY